ncbi:hypothetical protein WJX77_008608 [Trebouxia sp. C0004]
MTSLSSDHQHHPTNCSEMLTHALSENQQPNLSWKGACSQYLPGTSGSLGVPEPLAVHIRAPIQHYDFNAAPFEPLLLNRGAATPNAQQTFQHTSDTKPIRSLGLRSQDGERLRLLEVTLTAFLQTCQCLCQQQTTRAHAPATCLTAQDAYAGHFYVADACTVGVC